MFGTDMSVVGFELAEDQSDLTADVPITPTQGGHNIYFYKSIMLV